MKRLKILTLTTLWLTSIILAHGFGGLAGMYKPEFAKHSSTLALHILTFFYKESRCDKGNRLNCGFTDISKRSEVSCSPFKETNKQHAILFTFGQSNSANSGETPYKPKNEHVINFNPHDNKCYKAVDPLLGPSGTGGNVWTVLGDKLIDINQYKKVLIVPLGIGGTEIARWKPDGDLHIRVKHTAKQLLALNIMPTHILWHQGEADAMLETSGDNYKTMFLQISQSLKSYGIHAPMYPAIATYCGPHSSESIKESQKKLPKEIENVFPGANTDQLVDPQYRYDSCHFSKKGMEIHAQQWVDALTRSKKQNPDTIQ